MPLICGGTALLRKSSNRGERETCDDFVKAANAAYAAKAEVAAEGAVLIPQLAQVPKQIIKGEDVSLLVVLQREVGAVAPGEINPLSGSALQSRVCSIDATTCLIAGIRDPYSGTTVVAHFDHGGDQVEDGLVSMLNFLPAKPITTAGLLSNVRRDEIEGLTTQHKGKRYVELYLVGAVRHDRFSANTLSSALKAMADDQETIYDVVLHGVCVWSQNLVGRMIVHRGLMIDARTGACTPVECDKRRAYPGGRLRGLRCFDADDRHVSAVTLMPGETVATAVAADVVGKRRALQYVIIIRPFKYPDFGTLTARKPLSTFAEMSTSPEYEPEDFAETLKSSIVFASLTASDKVFTPAPSNLRKPLPVAFQLCVGEEAEVVPVVPGGPAAADASPAPSGEGDAAPATSERRPVFSWAQISPFVATESATVGAKSAAAAA